MKDNDDDDELDDEDDDGHGATLCRSCGESYVADEFWICCDICERWFHEGLNSMSKLILEAGGSVYSKYRDQGASCTLSEYVDNVHRGFDRLNSSKV
ncbi:PHD finger protein ALFIN-LIKE 3-like protein isoform X1 [Tanacetum coccineum]